MKLTPHLPFKGNCRQAFQFYADTLGGKILMQTTYGETPMAAQMPAHMREQIIHARMEFHGQSLMGADAPPDRYDGGHGIQLALGIDDLAQAKRTFEALSAGGTVTMPFQETFWARGFGMLTDRFGIAWMVNCEKPMGGAAAQSR
ncbi:MAG TPA: VOC family protein [Steroidobacteraceae bacterium]|nr:VOC family protein [Steroidobacteraceae bacterium]